MADTVIGFSQKLKDGSFTPRTLFGVIAENVDMFNGNDLEEEFKLGGPCVTSFSDDEESGNTIITEEYKISEQKDNYYKVVTEIGVDERGNTLISQKLFLVESEGMNTLIKSKKVTFEDIEGQTVIKEEMI